jgi:hypothetical protein
MRALDLLQESSEMLERALLLLQNGKVEEAEKLKVLARSKRTDSVLTMKEANNLEENSVAPDGPGATAE